MVDADALEGHASAVPSISPRQGVEAIPTAFLIAPDGKVEAEQDGPLGAQILDRWTAKAG